MPRYPPVSESGRQTEMWLRTTQQPAIIKVPPMWLICYCIASSDIHGTPDWPEQGSYKTKKNERFIIQLSPLLVENCRGEWLGEKSDVWGRLCDIVTGWQLSRKCNIFPVGCHWGKCGGWGGSWEPCHDTINSQQYLQISTPVTSHPVTAGSWGQH